MSDSIAVGSTVFVYDGNSRVYKRDERGRAYGPPIWREHWREHEIISETTRSWVLMNGTKINKKNPGNNVCFSVEELDKLAWVVKHRYKLAEVITRGGVTYEQLKQVAEILNYSEQENL